MTYESENIEVTQNTFKLILPNMNYFQAMQKVEESDAAITPQMQKVLNYITRNGKATDNELCELLNVKKTRIYNITKEMISRGLIISNGRGKNKYYSKKL